MAIKVIVTDVEGTTSSISFVKDVLFPYALGQMPDFIHRHADDEEVQAQLAWAADLADLEIVDTDTMISLLQEWIRNDQKITPLKNLQGMIWEEGYKKGDYQAHMYPDATHQLKRWHEFGIPLYVYSSGSIHAQKLFYGYSQDGDLTSLFSGHFDTSIGHKRESESYQAIEQEMLKQHAIQSHEILFLSDIKEELDAAALSGWKTAWLIREGQIPPSPAHPVYRSFEDIHLNEF